MSYSQMAEQLGLTYCRGITPIGHYCQLGDHKVGFVVGDTIHYADRSRTKSNTFTFLKLAALAAEPSINDDVPWRRVFRRGRLAREFGAQLGIRVSGYMWNADKAFVLAGVAGQPNTEPMRKLAFDWARRPRRAA